MEYQGHACNDRSRTTGVKNICGIELRKPINSVNTEGQWKKVKIGVDSCAAISCTPEGTFPGPIEVTPQVGEEYTTANAGIIYNQGQQRVEGYTDDYMPFCSKFQVTDVN